VIVEAAIFDTKPTKDTKGPVLAARGSLTWEAESASRNGRHALTFVSFVRFVFQFARPASSTDKTRLT